MSEPADRPSGAALPTSETAELALRESAALLGPVVRWLLRSGVSYPTFADAMKSVFLAAARAELDAGNVPASQSALSVLSGVHRKDVRALLAAGDAPPRVAPGVPLASQVFTRWLQDPALHDAEGRPRALPRSGPAPSFDALSRSLSTDVHPRTVLDELLRLGVVDIRGEEVVPHATGFVPAADLAGLVALFTANAGDHLAAAVHNLAGGEPPFLEQAVYAQGLTTESAAELATLARTLWSGVFAAMVDAARSKVDAESGDGGDQRIRFGTYFYSEPVVPPAPPPVPSRGGRRRAGGKDPA
jgi:hypothetical protein